MIRRFFPYVQLHEFEALLLSDPAETSIRSLTTTAHGISRPGGNGFSVSSLPSTSTTAAQPRRRNESIRAILLNYNGLEGICRPHRSRKDRAAHATLEMCPFRRVAS